MLTYDLPVHLTTLSVAMYVCTLRYLWLCTHARTCACTWGHINYQSNYITGPSLRNCYNLTMLHFCVQPPSMTSRVTEDSGYVNSGHPAAAKMAAPPPPPPTSTALPSLSSSPFPTLPSTSSGQDKPPVFTVPDFSSTQPPKPSAILSGLKFSAPPFSVKPVDHTEDQERNRSPPSDSQRGFNLTGNEAVPHAFLSQARKNLGVSTYCTVELTVLSACTRLLNLMWD